MLSTKPPFFLDTADSPLEHAIEPSAKAYPCSQKAVGFFTKP